MPYREIIFEKNQPIHVLSRAVEKRKIFEERTDCYKFIFQLYAANIGKPAFNLWRKDITKAAQSLLEGENMPSNFIIEEHSPLVYILNFALVVNHYHLNLIPRVENGVPKYMQKLNCGFAKYYNLKYHRNGALFGSRYKVIPIQTDFQLDAVSRYINVINPLDVYQPDWREQGLKDWRRAFEFLESYQFSSFPEMIGNRNSKILAPTEILEKYSFKRKIEDQKEYLNFIEDFLKQRLISFHPLFLEE